MSRAPSRRKRPVVRAVPRGAAQAAADVDDAAEKYLAGEKVPAPLLRAALAGDAGRKIFPVFAGSALRNTGCSRRWTASSTYLPSPEERFPAGRRPRTGVPATREPVPSAPFSALVFKVLQEEGRRTVYLRVYSGKAKEGDTLLNAATGQEGEGGAPVPDARREEGADRRRGGGDIVAARGIGSPARGHAVRPRGADRVRVDRDPQARSCRSSSSRGPGRWTAFRSSSAR